MPTMPTMPTGAQTENAPTPAHQVGFVGVSREQVVSGPPS
jgi:hypothetical protein